MKKYIVYLLAIFFMVTIYGCSETELMPLDGVWVSGEISFEIETYEDEVAQFYVLSYLTGNAGTYTFDLTNNNFVFFERSRSGTPGNYVYHKTILKDSDLYFMMHYSARTDVIQLLYLNFETEPLIFERQK